MAAHRPNGSRLSCGRNADGRKAAEWPMEPAGEGTQFFPLEPASFKRLLGGGFADGTVKKWPLMQQTRHSVQHSYEVKRTEDRLVVLRKPQRKVDVEIIAPIRRIPSGDVRQWTSPTVKHDNQHLDRNDPDEDQRSAASVRIDQNWNGEDAACEERPNHRMDALNEN